MANKLFGGWYPNPDAGGKVMRWWGAWGWTNGEDPTGGAGPNSSPTSSLSGGLSSSGIDEFANLFAKLSASPIQLPPLQTKTWEEYEKQALEELRPYYERILREEGGDVEKAKQRLEEDYQRGIRIKREDWEIAKRNYGPQMLPNESIAQYYNRTKYDYGTFPEEGISAFSNLNKRNILQSGIANYTADKVRTAQQARQEAIDLALRRYEEEAGIAKQRKLDDTDTQWQRRQFQLEEEKKTNAANLARQKRSDDIALQQIERENLMRKAINNYYG
jgi:hypothetical protein